MRNVEYHSPDIIRRIEHNDDCREISLDHLRPLGTTNEEILEIKLPIPNYRCDGIALPSNQL